jgi:predicted transcriptional regulator
MKTARADVFVRMEPDLAARLDRQVEIARATMPGVSKASIVRAAILAYVERLEAEQPAQKRKR